MTALEERLRTELPELASGLMGETEAPLELLEEPTITADHEAVVPRRRLLVGTAAAALTGVGVVAAGRWFSPGRATNPLATSADPTGFGSWRAIADAPMVPREGGLAAWNGETAVFWAGRTGEGNGVSTFSSGAFYDPATDSWERADTPTFTHPGFDGIAVGDEVYAVAKGGGHRVNLRDGSSSELQAPIALRTVLDLGGRVWGVGTDRRLGFESDANLLTFAEYFPESDSWGEVISQKAPAGAATAAVGDELVSCNTEGDCVFVDPGALGEEGAFRILARPNTSTFPTIAFASNDVLALTIATKDRRSREVYRASGDDWQLVGVIPTGELDGATFADAGDWLLVLSPTQPPVAVNVASGDWHQFDDWPMTGVRNPNSVWTGTQLIVWGGLESEGSEGAIWTPPAS